ncbi:MAG: DNA polymerase III subunit delta [Pseudomonadota bacterium]
MRIYPEKLEASLSSQLHPVYLISGDETLIVQECADQVRAAARQHGCSERSVFDANESGFRWDDLTQDASSMSLFAERKLIELRVPNGKFGADGSKALTAYLSQGGDDILLIVAGKIDRASTNSKWYKAIDGHGATIQIWPINAQELPRWLQQRAQAIGLRIQREALSVLAERVEGNLLAAAQELEKLRLLGSDQEVTTELVLDSVGNSARFNLFAMVDCALAGRQAESLKMLNSLRSEGAQPPALLWAFIRELRGLQDLLLAVQSGMSPAQALNEARVWKNRQGILAAAIKRHTLAGVDELISLAADVDGAVKGFRSGSAWEQLEWLVFGLAGDGHYPLKMPS